MLQSVLLVAYFLLLAVLVLRVYRSASFPGASAHMSRGSHSYKYWIGRYQRHPYHAVSCSGDCECLKGFCEKRYLGDEAPPLPVPSCRKPECDCTYVHFNDRRDKYHDRRRLEGRMDPGLDRRKSPGRRASDGVLAYEGLLAAAAG